MSIFGCANNEKFERELGIDDCEIIDDELVYYDTNRNFLDMENKDNANIKK